MQDQRALEYMGDALRAGNGDVGLVPAFWYVGHIPSESEWNSVPDGGGNVLTIREYQAGWLADYDRIARGEIIVEHPSGIATPTPCAAPAGVPIPAVNGVALPLAGFPREIWSSGHHTYPAIDLIIPTGTPVYAWHSGTVRSVTNFARTCSSRDGCESTCGIGVTVLDAQWPDLTWTYCHLSARTVEPGAVVNAGDNLGLSGNTGRSGTPHLHIEFRFNGAADSRVCPQNLYLQIHDQPGTLLDPHTLPRLGAGC